MQRREERIVQLEEELKHKIAEVSRQLTVKEEEVVNVKKRFKEERLSLEQDKKKLQQQVEDLKCRNETVEHKLVSLKRDIDESPLSVLRSELAQKNLSLVEAETKIKNIAEERDEVRKKFEVLKKDMVTLKKQMDREEKDTLGRQAEELDKLKVDIRNKQLQDEERREINALKSQLAALTSKLSETHGSKAAPETINPFATQGFVPAATTQKTFLGPTNGGLIGQQPLYFVDNYAIQQPSPMKKTLAFTNGNDELERLIREREDLMRTGCYSNDDPLIQELERQIRTTQLRMN